MSVCLSVCMSVCLCLSVCTKSLLNLHLNTDVYILILVCYFDVLRLCFRFERLNKQQSTGQVKTVDIPLVCARIVGVTVQCRNRHMHYSIPLTSFIKIENHAHFIHDVSFYLFSLEISRFLFHKIHHLVFWTWYIALSALSVAEPSQCPQSYRPQPCGPRSRPINPRYGHNRPISSQQSG